MASLPLAQDPHHLDAAGSGLDSFWMAEVDPATLHDTPATSPSPFQACESAMEPHLSRDVEDAVSARRRTRVQFMVCTHLSGRAARLGGSECSSPQAAVLLVPRRRS